MSDKEKSKKKSQGKWLKLQDELERTKQKTQDYHDKYLRTLAELENYRKRVEKERQDFIKFSKQDLVYELLPLLDNFEMALHHVKNTTEPKKIIEGIELIERQFKDILRREGLEIIKSEGEQFNPHIHEAMVHEESDKHPEGFIIEGLRKGYILGGKVIRPAQVKVTTTKTTKGEDTVNSKLKTHPSSTESGRGRENSK